MIDFLLSNLNLPKELIVLLCAAIPVIELRGAIPIGFMLNVSPKLTFFACNDWFHSPCSIYDCFFSKGSHLYETTPNTSYADSLL